MTDAFTALWEDAVARLHPERTLLVGPGSGGMAAAVLSLTESWGGLLDLACPSPAGEQPPRHGHRFTMHIARPQDAAGLLPVPDLIIIEAHEAEGFGRMVTGLLNVLLFQTRRMAKPFPPVLLFGVLASDTSEHCIPGSETRPPALAAIEDFVAAEAPRLQYVVMPLLGGAAIISEHTGTAHDALRAIISRLMMGETARRAAEETEAARVALLVDNDRLKEQIDAAERRADFLYAALRRAQLQSPSPGNSDLNNAGHRPAGKLIQASRRTLGKLLTIAGWRDSPIVSSQPDDSAAIGRLRRSPILSEEWYHAKYPDVAASGMDPAEHYYRYGAAEGRDPGPDFITAFYLAGALDVAQSGVNPLLHFLDHGGREGRRPSPDFDAAFYLAENPDVTEAGINPLEHFVAQGRAEGRRGLPPH